jgi:hypothetical protein
MDPGEQTTGTRDEHYNLISVLYHALHGAENCEVYIADAEAAGQDDLVGFFREAQAMQAALAEQAKGHLGIGGTTPGDIMGGVTAGGAVGESGVVTSGRVSGETLSGATDVPREEQLVAEVPDESPDITAEDALEGARPEPPPDTRREPPPVGPPPDANPPA